ncbi:MAG: NAD-dependent epimerase/dehydratase family protein [Polynucleobacter sp.]|nr:NAD-dependent epimerase/dehydratase family protein [Polynucleobacter sp.]
MFDIQIVGSKEICLTANSYDFVIYASGNSSPRKSSIEPGECLESNCIALLAAIQKFKKAHWILVSSVSVYENSKLEIHNEDDEIIISDQTSIYAAHKTLNEYYVKKFIQKYCIIRLSYMYGDLSKKNIFFDLRADSNTIFLYPSSVLRPINIRYVINSVLQIVEELMVGVFNIANTNTISIDEILALKNKKYTYKNERYIDESNICVDKFRKEFKFNENAEELKEDIRRYINF